MFGNTGTFTTNKTNSINVNTRLSTSYSDESMLSIGAWNSNLSLKFHPATGKTAEGLTQYSQDNTSIVNVIITPDNCKALLEGIKTSIIPAISTKESATVAIKTGNGDTTKILCVGTNNGTPYVYVAKNLMNGIADDSNVVMHTFPKRSYLTNYSYKTGEGTEVIINTGFMNFIKRLEGIDRIVPDVSHSISYSTAIRSAMANRGTSSFNQSNSDNKYEAPVNTFDGMSADEFLPFS